MEGSDGSPPSSLWMIHAAELFPKPPMEKEDEQLTVPFQELAGESVKYLGRTDDGVLALSNYRLFLLKNSTYSETSVPLGLIESAQIRDLFHLIINCKDASTVKCSFETAEQCSEWQRRITLSVGVPETLESLFAFPFYSWTCDTRTTQQQQQQHHQQQQTASQHHGTGNSISCGGINGTDGSNNEWSGRLQRAARFEDDFRKEVERLQFDVNGVWRISSANEDFKLCPSYPPLILVPCCISDDTLQNVANFRGSRRLPAVVWRHKQSGAVIARSSQPEVGWLGWRNSKDEQLLKALADACAFDRGEQSRKQNLCTSGDSTPSSAEGSHEEVCLDEIRKILIVDARSYTSAVTNRARGGGCECIEYYPCAEIEFMNLGNIHAIRKSFHALRQLCASPPDVPNWLGLLERTMWLQHLSGLLAASMTVCHAIEKKGRPVLVHCSDGWDRTPQIVATAQLCLDPYYRTVEGFRILVEREWLNFGHKFADRCGHGPGSEELNERCPVFLQWLDMVHQIHRQFPCCFEFSMAYLIKLAQHSHSCLFGTFLCNSLKERIENSVLERTFSVWPFLSGSIYKNPLYVPNKEKVLWPAHNVRDLVLWSEVYLGSLGNQNSSDCLPTTTDTNQGSTSPMTKTRSYGDLMSVGGTQNGLTRRSSDPNMIVESHLITNSESDSIIDASSDSRGVDSPDIIANMIHDTTEKLQNLTNELNQSEDEEICKINSIEVENGQKQNEKKINIVVDDKIQSDVTIILPTTDDNDDMQQFEKLENSINQHIKDLIIDNRKEEEEEVASTVTNDNESYENNGDFSLISRKNDEMTTNILLQNGNCLDQNHDDISNNCIDNDLTDGCSQPEQLNDNNFNKNHEMLESIDLKASANSISPLSSSLAMHSSSENQQNLWHGSINTSTDTLVPIETHLQRQQQQQQKDQEQLYDFIDDQEVPNTNQSSTIIVNNSNSSPLDESMTSSLIQRKTPTSNILPEVHNKYKSNNNFSNLHDINASILSSSPVTTASIPLTSTAIGMDESILILPEHQKLEISSSGKCETIANSITSSASSSYQNHRRRRTSSSNSKYDPLNNYKNINNASATNSRFSTPGIRSLPLTPPGGSSTSDRVPVNIACPDGLAHALSEQNIRLQQIVYEHKLREDALLRELHGMRMALLKKTCPQCNSQPLVNDEQNSILDNIENSSICSWEAVEDRSSGQSSGASSAQPPATNNSVLWVPDHAVTRCTGCQIEFWLGRRKHHCRSCGQIFCADCSEFWAPLPDERLFTPVRLCGPCYKSVTAGMQQHQQKLLNNRNSLQSSVTEEIAATITTINNSSPLSLSSSCSSNNTITTNAIHIHNNTTATTSTLNCNTSCNNSSNSSTNISTAIASSNCLTNSNLTVATVTTSTSLEACKHAVNPSINDHGPFKATAASN